MSEKTILIAEDDSLMAELIEHRLKRDGHKTVVVEDGIAAVDEVKSLKPDAIILDGMLPGMDGSNPSCRMNCPQDWLVCWRDVLSSHVVPRRLSGNGCRIVCRCAHLRDSECVGTGRVV
jgi:AmiR/NasT family two-component response regulator